MIARRNEVCQEYALTINHQHCIGCMLVLEHMQRNHPEMKYGTVEQWVEESAYCGRHEREIFREFLRSKGLNV
jgi:hypothetical protein